MILHNLCDHVRLFLHNDTTIWNHDHAGSSILILHYLARQCLKDLEAYCNILNESSSSVSRIFFHEIA